MGKKHARKTVKKPESSLDAAAASEMAYLDSGAPPEGAVALPLGAGGPRKKFKAGGDHVKVCGPQHFLLTSL